MVSTASSTQQVCMVQAPAIVVGGVGESTDPFGNKPFPCQPGGGDLYGCDIASADAIASADRFSPKQPPDTVSERTGPTLGEGIFGAREAASVTPAANDMETAAIAREAAVRGVRFIAFRAVSDGAGDPLKLPGFPYQFSAYYHFAAHNAAAATAAFLQQLASD